MRTDIFAVSNSKNKRGTKAITVLSPTNLQPYLHFNRTRKSNARKICLISTNGGFEDVDNPEEGRKLRPTTLKQLLAPSRQIIGTTTNHWHHHDIHVDNDDIMM
eukprot:m.85235 g.85235  ORF g.85235 m.85235 type:complete len:104 (+) comp25850_c0_seq1:78-389(+)